MVLGEENPANHDMLTVEDSTAHIDLKKEQDAVV